MKLRNREIFAGLFLASTALTPAVAQSAESVLPPSEFRTLDSNGVNLSNGDLVLRAISISIGNPSSGLSFSRTLTRNQAWDSTRGTINLTGSTYAVTIGTSSEDFTLSNGAYTPVVPRGSTLTYDTAGQSWTYTMRDGTVATFSKAITGDIETFAGNQGNITSLVEPNGETHSYSYTTGSVCVPQGSGCTSETALRLQAIGSNLGWQLHLTYAGDTLASATDISPWQELSRIVLLNLASDYCDPNLNSCSTSNAVQSIDVSGQNGPYEASSYSNAMGRSTDFTYDASGNLVAMRLPGHARDDVTIGYDPEGRVASVTKKGVQTTYSYSDDTVSAVRTTTVTRADSDQWTYKFSLSDLQPISITDPLGHAAAKTYNVSRLVQSVTMPEGNHVDFAYDSRGNITQITRYPKSGPETITIMAAYPATCPNQKTCNKPTSTTDANGNTTSYTYDPNSGGLASITYPQPQDSSGKLLSQPSVNYTYAPLQAYYRNSAGSIVASGQDVYLLTRVSACQTLSACTGTSSSDASQTILSYGPQSAGIGNNLFLVSHSAGDGAGALTATRTITYDNLGDVLTLDGPLDGAIDTRKYVYDSGRERVGIISEDPDAQGPLKNRAKKIVYAADGQVSKEELGTVNSQLDADWSSFAALKTVDIGYDAQNRPTSRKLSAVGIDFALKQISYDSHGRPDCAAIRMNTGVYGALPPSACSQTTGNGDYISQLTFDAAGRVSGRNVGVGSAAAAAERTLSYTPNGKIASLSDGDGNTVAYAYDSFDRFNTATYPDGSTRTVDTYDNDGHVTKSLNREAQAATFSYDALGRLLTKSPAGQLSVTYAYDNLGRMTSASQGATSVSLTYDALGRNIDQTGPHGTFASEYDLKGRRTKVTYPDGTYFNYDRSWTGEVVAIRENGATSGAGVLASYTYDALGKPTKITFGNGTSQNFTYDPISRLSSLNIAGLPSADDLTVDTVTYNPASQITSKKRYDAAGNGTFSWTGYGSVTRTDIVNALNQVTQRDSSLGPSSVVFSYDKNGNLTSDDTNTFAYDSENRLISVGKDRLSYDPSGRLVEVGAQTTTDFAYDGHNLVGEYDSSGHLLRRYVFGPGMDRPIVQYEGPGLSDRRWLYSDERGSVVASADVNAALVYTNRYDEFGNPPLDANRNSLNTGRFQYTGQVWLPEVGVYHYKARLYSASLGRFMQADPVGTRGGANVYAYARNDPINLADPAGTCPACIPGAIGFGVGVGVSMYDQYESSGSVDLSWSGLGEDLNYGIAGAAAAYGPELFGADYGALALWYGSVGATAAGDGDLINGVYGDQMAQDMLFGGVEGEITGWAGQGMEGLMPGYSYSTWSEGGEFQITDGGGNWYTVQADQSEMASEFYSGTLSGVVDAITLTVYDQFGNSYTTEVDSSDTYASDPLGFSYSEDTSIDDLYGDDPFGFGSSDDDPLNIDRSLPTDGGGN